MAVVEPNREVSVSPLIGARKKADLNESEQQFSTFLHERVQDLLKGTCNRIDLLRKYLDEPDRLGVIDTPAAIQRDRLRLPVVEEMLYRTVSFMCRAGDGGPVSQHVDENGDVVESQTFSTRYAHIVVERIDRYPEGRSDPSTITWYVRRLQNQRAQTQINRALDAANLAFEIFRMVK